MNELTFTHTFGDGSVCTVKVADTRPDPNIELCLEFDWSRFDPKPALFSEYRQWILGVTEELATRWNASVMYVLREEVWGVEPGEPAKLLNKGGESR
jgi:hypothetical protein